VSRVIAAVDNSAAAQPVLGMASLLGPVLGASVQAVHISDDDGQTARANAERLSVPFEVRKGDPLEELASLVGDEDVVAAVVGTRGHPARRHRVGHLAPALADATDKPVMVVPPGAHMPTRIAKVLVAMEGTPAKARTTRRVIDLTRTAGVELIAVHVDDETSIPSFSDQVAHETGAFAEEFIARYCQGRPEVHLELRVGMPVDEILQAIREIEPDVLVIGWPRHAAPGHARVAHELLAQSPIPVLLVAVV
jgi:nucleotide-binding universal stress UspA family protein